MSAVVSTQVQDSRAQQSMAECCCVPHFELRFAGLFNAGRGYSFPCDAQGRVDIDSLSGHARLNYFYARTSVGREFSAPVVLASDMND